MQTHLTFAVQPMSTTACLHHDDRAFFALIAKVIFTNPFAVDHSEVEVLASTTAIRNRAYDHLFSALLPALNERFRRLEQQGLATLTPFTGEDRTLLEHAFLFDIYHRFLSELDALIQIELAAPGKPAPVPFAGQALALLQARGFSAAEAVRYFGLFYQLRRAYYFIDRHLLGHSLSMRKLKLALWNNVFTYDARIYDRHLWNRMEDFSTLLLGETGTGKGTAAAAIGRSGYIPFDDKAGRFQHSFTDTFIAINLNQFSATLIESELFGHRKGAFTGAIDNHQGVFERCHPCGSLLLDEIGDASVAIQIKLLQVLQERTFLPVGSRTPLRFSGRVIAATHQPLAELRRQGQFRDDFFYRLCADIIVMPTLRERIAESDSELPLLVRGQIARMTGADSPDLTARLLETLRRDLPHDYPWPGNVRELEQAIRRILLTRHYFGDSTLRAPDPLAAFACQVQSGILDARELLGRYCELLYQQSGSYEEVARRTGLDRRTVKKYMDAQLDNESVR